MTFSITTMLMKVVKLGIQAVIAWVGADNLNKLGITINEEVLAIGLLGVLEALRNYLKVKLGWKWL